MEELVSMVAQRTGISPDQARTAIQTVIEQLRTHLPAPLAAHLDSFIAASSSGGGVSSALGSLGSLGGMVGQLEGMFDDKKS